MTATWTSGWRRIAMARRRGLIGDAVFAVALGLFVLLATLLTSARSRSVDPSTSQYLMLLLAWTAAPAMVTRALDHWFRRYDALPLVRAWFTLMAWGFVLQLRIKPGETLRPATYVVLGASVVLFLAGAWAGRWGATADRDEVRQVTLWSIVLGLALVVGTMAAAQPTSGTRFSLKIGSLTYQPGEIARVLLVIAFAGAVYGPRWRPAAGRAAREDGRVRLVDRLFDRALSYGRIPYLRIPWRTATIATVMLGVAGALFSIQNDIGPALLLLVTLVITIATVTNVSRTRVVLAVVVAIVVVATVATWSSGSGGKIDIRWSQFVHPFPRVDGHEAPSQLGQALLANERGWPLGSGLGRGGTSVVPAAHTDFILTVLTEEWGIPGLAAVVALALFLLHRCWLHVRGSVAGFGQSVAVGLTSLLAAQYLIVLLGVSRVFLQTGLTVPFLSQGGSSLNALALLLGIVVGLGHPGDRSHVHTPIARRTGRLEPVLAIAMVLVCLVGFVAWPARVTSLARQDHERALARAADPDRPTIVTQDDDPTKIAYTTSRADGCPGWTSTSGAPARFRCYPNGRLYSDVSGFVDTDAKSAAGLDELLARTSSCTRPGQGRGIMYGTRCREYPVFHTTLDADLQKDARATLAAAPGRPQVGSVVISDPANGDVRAIFSSPRFDANLRTWPGGIRTDSNRLSFLQAGEQKGVGGPRSLERLVRTTERYFERPRSFPSADREGVRDDARDSVTDSTARSWAFPAGSLATLVTAAAAFENPEAVKDFVPRDPPPSERPKQRCGRAVADLLAHTCDQAFGELAATLGWYPLTATSIDLGFADVDSINDPSGPYFDGLTTARAPRPFTQRDSASLARDGSGTGTIRLTAVQVSSLLGIISQGGIRIPLRLIADCQERRDLGLPASPSCSRVAFRPSAKPTPGSGAGRRTTPCSGEDCELAPEPVLQPTTAKALRSAMDRQVREPGGAASALRNVVVDGHPVRVSALAATAREGGRHIFTDGWCAAIVSWGPASRAQARTFVIVLRGSDRHSITGGDACTALRPIITRTVAAGG